MAQLGRIVMDLRSFSVQCDNEEGRDVGLGSTECPRQTVRPRHSKQNEWWNF
jgi:hypothetical protein